MSNIVVFSPNRFSLHTTTMTELLLREGVQVSAIFVRRLFNPNRFFSEYKRDGSRLLRKIWEKLFLRDKAYEEEDFETIVDFRKRKEITLKKVDDFKQFHKIPVIYCNTLNDDIVAEELKKIKPELVVFTGGGLIRKEVLSNSGAGILNCHMGILPEYRGMDVVEWPILENKPEQVGITVHFMDEGIDTGDILRIRKIEVKKNENMKQLRDRFEPIMCHEMVRTCIDFLQGNLEKQTQKHEDGKQYFMIHPRLIELVERKQIC